MESWKNSSLFFLNFVSFSLKKKYIVLFYLAVVFQQYQMYQVWKNIWKVTKDGEKCKRESQIVL